LFGKVEYLPDSPAAHCHLGKTLKEQGRGGEAEACFRRAIELQADSAVPYYLLGNTLYFRQPTEAEACFRRAIELQPDFAVAHCNLGSLLGRQRKIVEEQACYRRAIELDPLLAEAHNNLGRTLRKQGRLTEAEECHRQALALRGDSAEIHYNLGEDLAAQGRPKEAETCFRRAIELKPAFVAGHCRLGRMLAAQGMFPEAESSYLTAIERDPGCAEAIYALANLLYAAGNTLEAAAYYRRVIQLKPESAFAFTNLGGALGAQGDLVYEELCYRRAIELNPDLAAAHSNLGNTLKRQGKISDARACYQKAIEIEPGFAEAICNLGTLQQEQGLRKEAEHCYRRSLAIKPDFDVAHSNLLFTLLHSPDINEKDLFTEHCRFGDHFEKPLQAAWVKHSNSCDPQRQLRIGFVSADLRNHPVASFTELVLGHLAQSPMVCLHAFASQTVEDETTDRLRSHFQHWHPIAHLSDAALAARVRSEGIDILIDLSGHTAKNRMLTFARKPAPLQASWIGYMATTGLSCMDYYFADRFLIPKSNLPSLFTEKIIHLPAVASFLPSIHAPAINLLPALRNGFLTFGSFNRMSKLHPAVIQLWAKLLLAAPKSRMLIGNLPVEGGAEVISGWFQREGIRADRLGLYSTSDARSFHALHHEVDLCLDTFPYTGFTTTADAAWMGVPTLTLRGLSCITRQSACLLSHLGLEEFIADDAAGFVVRGIYWANHFEALAGIRAGFRQRFAQSTLGRPECVARGLLDALRTIWIRWCEGVSS
jgi:protein O-GlcNAc transferase